MQPLAANSARHPGALTITPFNGTVTVRFSDAIVASTEEKTNTTTRSPLKGTASYWRVHAVGGAADDFMWAYETPDTPALAIARHGAFDPDKARIDADPAEDKRHTPHIPE
jgi:uncharacterized protein (DUF427 family)